MSKRGLIAGAANILVATLLTVCSAFAHASAADAAPNEQPSAAADNAIPDLQGLWITLLESIPSDDPLRDSSLSTWYVSVADSDASLIDAPPALTARVRIPGIQVLSPAISPYSSVSGPGDTVEPIIFIHFPTRRENGQYEVWYEFHIGNSGANLIRAIAKHDEAGWHVLSRGPYPGPNDRTIPIIM